MAQRVGTMSVYNPATYCYDRRCFRHDEGPEHHYEGCYMHDTVAQAVHRFDHAMGAVQDQLLTLVPTDIEMLLLSRTWRGRLGVWLSGWAR